MIHDYLKLDRALVYDIINNNLNDIEDFIKIIVEYI
ncbi:MULTISPECIES: HepT-like ribonuclease domain-containing protein [Clostridium]|nr:MULTISPECIES: HepT-like ribonuclease domain-containing protein [Clostridium]